MYHSLYGRRLGLNENSLLLDGTPVGQLPQAWGRGNTFYVDSAVAGSDGTSPATALGTLAAAIAKCTANQGDVVIMLPGHAETISSSTALTLSVAGVRIVGLGVGDNRPKLTLDTANTATVNVSAANVMVSNIRLVANFLSIAAAFTLAAAKNFTLDRVAFQETSSVLNFLNAIKSTGIANTVDGLTAVECTWNGLGTTSVNAFILTANDIDGLKVVRNRIKLARTADSSAIVVTAGVLTNADIGDNAIYTAQTACSAGSLINVGGTTSTGFVYRNFAQTLTTTSDKLFTTTVGLAAFENRVTGAVGATGFVIPAVDS